MVRRLLDVRGEEPVLTGRSQGPDKGRSMEQNRFVVSKRCVQCGAVFDAITIARYCSNACRQRAKRAKRVR